MASESKPSSFPKKLLGPWAAKFQKRASRQPQTLTSGAAQTSDAATLSQSSSNASTTATGPPAYNGPVVSADPLEDGKILLHRYKSETVHQQEKDGEILVSGSKAEHASMARSKQALEHKLFTGPAPAAEELRRKGKISKEVDQDRVCNHEQLENGDIVVDYVYPPESLPLSTDRLFALEAVVLKLNNELKKQGGVVLKLSNDLKKQEASLYTAEIPYKARQALDYHMWNELTEETQRVLSELGVNDFSVLFSPMSQRKFWTQAKKDAVAKALGELPVEMKSTRSKLSAQYRKLEERHGTAHPTVYKDDYMSYWAAQANEWTAEELQLLYTLVNGKIWHNYDQTECYAFEEGSKPAGVIEGLQI